MSTGTNGQWVDDHHVGWKINDATAHDLALELYRNSQFSGLL
jgi:hypothetical protein